MNEITKRTIDAYKNHLIEEEKCSVTIEKYIRDITAFVNWTEGNEITKALVLEYKSMLTQQYAPASVNSVLSSLNGYFNYIERYDLKVKNLKVQRQIFCQSEKELTKAEYERLLKAAKSKKNERLYLIMQTICATGIRVSELKYVDVNSVMTGHKHYQNLYHRKWLNPSQTNAKNGTRADAKLKNHIISIMWQNN